jgi:hypothetical protein
MTAQPVPRRHWRSYGNDPLPTGAEALDEPLLAFPSWLLRIVCDRCSKERTIAETHMAHGEMLIRDIIDRMRHDGCGGRGEGGVAHRHRGRQQPPGAADRACRRRRPLTGQRAMVVVPRNCRASFRARWAVPTIAWRRGGRRDWHRHSQTDGGRSRRSQRLAEKRCNLVSDGAAPDPCRPLG